MLGRDVQGKPRSGHQSQAALDLAGGLSVIFRKPDLDFRSFYFSLPSNAAAAWTKSAWLKSRSDSVELKSSQDALWKRNTCQCNTTLYSGF